MLAAVLPARLKVGLSLSLQQLAEEGMIVCIEEHPVAVYFFENNLIKETLYDLMPPR
jgi:hypothetical protein